MDNSQTFFDRLREKYDNLTKKQVKLAKYISINYKDAAFMTCSMIGREAGISEASVVRFAVALGYESYTEMMRHLQEYMKREITVLDKIKNFEKDVKYSSSYNHIIENNMKLVKNLQKSVSQKEIDRVVKDISDHRNIVICGYEDMAMLADFLCYNLTRMGCDAEVLNNTCKDPFKVLNSIDRDTFIIAFDSPMYFEKQIRLIKSAKERGGKVFSITDSLMAPLNDISDYSMIIPITNNYTTSTENFVSFLTVFQIIIFEYGFRNPVDVERTMREHFKFMKEFDN